jgi:signal transduction histidine kinase
VLTLALLTAGLLLVASVHLLAMVAALGLRKRWIARGRRGADEAVALIAISGLWPLVYLVEILVPAEQKLILSGFEAANAALVPFAWGGLLLALDGRVDRKFRLGWTAFAVLFASAVFTVSATHEWHQLYWGSARIVNHPGFTLLSTTKGPIAAFVTGLYTLGLVGIIVLAWRARRSVPGVDGPTATLLILAGLAPFLASAVDDAGLRPLQGLDLEPYAVLFPGLVLVLLVQMLYKWDLAQQARNLLFEASPDGIIVLTLDGRVWDINKAAATLLAIPEGKGPGARLTDIWPGVPSLGDGFADWNRDGRTLEIVAFSVVEEGIKVGTALVLRDVTESRAAATRAALADRLGQMGIVTTGLAHEINNPLAVVLVGVEHAMQVIEKVPGTDMARMALTDAHQAAGQLRAVARSLRDFAHLDDEPVRSIVVTEAIERSLTVMGRALTANARIERLFEPVAPVRMPPGRLEQVLVALLRNASQALAGRPGPERLILRVLQDPGEVVIEVEDSGPGMTYDVLERAFEPFFTTRGHGGGTGLGLYVARALVERYGGRLTLDSGPGRGTRARVRIPASTEVPSPTPPTTAADTPSPALSRRRILIVDDDPRVGKALARLLHEHEVTVVHDGEQAVQAMARLRYDLVLCDVMMPKMSGIEVYETAVDVDPAIGETFVFITGGTFTPEATAFLDRFPGRVLEKPIAAASLRDAIRRARTRP